MAPSNSLTSKTDLDTKIVILNVLVQKLWPQMSFYKMVTNITRSNMSQVQTIHEHFLKFTLINAFCRLISEIWLKM